MLVIRLQKTGRTNYKSYKIVVTDKTKSSTHGRSVEEVGFYNPATKEKVLKGARIKYWISVGAQPSATVHNLLISEKIIEGVKIAKHKKAKSKGGEAPPAKAAPAAVSEQPATQPASAGAEAKPE